MQYEIQDDGSLLIYMRLQTVTTEFVRRHQSSELQQALLQGAFPVEFVGDAKDKLADMFDLPIGGDTQ